MTDGPDRPAGGKTEDLSAASGPRLVVVGVGGAGSNAVNNMIQAKLEGVEFVAANTDAQALALSLCDRRIQMGRGITRGLGAGSQPDVGRAAAEEALDDILASIDGANMIFITAGMGGGTGTGAAPVIARTARDAGVLTIGVVTKPFQFEGARRMRVAEAGIQELTQYVDTLIVIPNQNLFRVANERTTFADAFKLADEVLHSGVRGVTDLMVMPGLINLDFADIRSVMSEMGKAIMGTGEAEGENRALEAAEAAISNPLLDEVSMKGARGVLINITGGLDLTLFEVDQAANRIREEVDSEANIIFGSTFDQRLEGRMRVSVVATGIDADEFARPKSVPLSLVVNKPKDRTPARQVVDDEPATNIVEARDASEPMADEGEQTGETVAEGEEAAPSALETSAPPATVESAPEQPTEPEPTPVKATLSAALRAAEARTPDAVDSGPAQPAGEPTVGGEQGEGQAPAARDLVETLRALKPDPGDGGQPATRAAGGTSASDPKPQKRKANGIFSWMGGGGASNPDELFDKGERYYYGQGVERDLAAAFRAYTKAAEQGHAGAQNRVGWMYEKGEGVEANHEAAVSWYRRAAEQGHINAMNDLGYMYRQGWGVSQSYEEALAWFRKAAERYDSYAEYNLGQMYEHGWGVQRDMGEAVRWFRRSAARGHEWAAKRLEELGVRS